jgi:hypothetical protein
MIFFCPHIRTYFLKVSCGIVSEIHNLVDDSAFMYVYTEDTVKNVPTMSHPSSMVLHYLNNEDITHNHLVIFSDSCSDQNKNSEKKKPTGRLKVSTAEEDNALLQHLEQNPFHIMRHAAQETNLPGSRVTACRRIKSVPM